MKFRDAIFGSFLLCFIGKQLVKIELSIMTIIINFMVLFVCVSVFSWVYMLRQAIKL